MYRWSILPCLALLSACQSYYGVKPDAPPAALQDPGTRLIAEAKKYFGDGARKQAYDVMDIAIGTTADKATAYLEYARMLMEAGELQRALQMAQHSLQHGDNKLQREKARRQLKKINKRLKRK